MGTGKNRLTTTVDKGDHFETIDPAPALHVMHGCDFNSDVRLRLRLRRNGGAFRPDQPFPDVNPDDGPPAGNPSGRASIPAEANLEDVTAPDQIVGNGTPESCSAEAFIDAVAQGGTMTATR